MRTNQWTKLYTILFLTLGLLLIEHKLHLTSSGHKVLLLFLVVFSYALIGLWIKSNTAVLEGETYEVDRKQGPKYQDLPVSKTSAPIPSMLQRETGDD